MSNPEFAFRVDDDTESWALYRQTATQERPIAVRTRDRTLWFGLDREDGNGDREPVRDDFLDAVGALFLRGPAGRDWTLTPIFDALTWYESECIEELRELRNETMASRSPDVDGRSMPSEAWDLVEAARSHFTLSDSRAYKPGDRSTKDHERGEHPDDSSLGDFGSA
ncbi:hypothetical protein CHINAEXTREME_20450 (plasmid) [Halobiforma lacisalsi AJ5]|uniref:Uncharacterized protein n=1 Tax=Natronobacterium lacisalsi AJ5 TaxID=358396 RepID=M0LW66_NATLA|nr:hypothetical protein [Halobiforma lacisalsi]APX00186.1 hypothetical protein CHINAEXTREME_20450 [Halobiforma lacisalsi AJ5]EMA37398.1 hypothetical protein C445_00876 [Halobiforma lacisalsi AJ5]